jgi:hypothetical protein
MGTILTGAGLGTFPTEAVRSFIDNSSINI